jgi:hypothetical protein
MYNMFDISVGSYKIKGEYIFIVLLMLALVSHLMCGCSKISMKDGFTLMMDQYEQYDLKNEKKVDTSKWFQKDLTTKAGSAELVARAEQPVPLPEGQLDMFATTPFKPECCPGFYSNSAGCACVTQKQAKYLQERGGNNVPFSEY